MGGPRGTLPAGGTELTGHRDYYPGDDYRQVDWNLCARHDELLMKEYRGQADRPVYILLDCSASMALGRPSKFDVARQAAAAVAYVALAELDPVGLTAFSDRPVSDFAPVRGEMKIVALLRFLEKLTPRREPTRLTAAAKTFVARQERPGLAVVVSDFFSPGGFRGGLEVLRHSGYEPRVVRICDPLDAQPDLLGDSELLDVESGDSWQVTVNERHLAEYRKLHAQLCKSIRDYCAGYGLRQTQVSTDLAPDDLLLAAIGARG